MRRCLFVTMEFWPFRGGVARYYKNFCDSFGGGMDVYVVEGAPESRTQSQKVIKSKSHKVEEQDPHLHLPLGNGSRVSGARLDETGYSVIKRKSYWKWMRPRWGKLLIDLFFYIKKNSPPVVFVGNVLPIGLIALLLQRLFRFDYVMFLHGLDVQFARHGRWHRKLVTRYILRNACTIIVNSEYTKREAAKAFGIPVQKIMVVWPKAFGNTVESQKVHKVESSNNVMVSMPALPRRGRSNHYISEALRQVQGDIQLPIVLSAGRLVPRKGFDDVIEVAKHFVGKAQFIIFGRGNDETRLRSLIAQYKLESTVSLVTADLSDKDMEALYEECDVFLFLPKELFGGDVEGFGQVVLEAQAHGKSVIVRNSGGSGEALIDGETGFLVNDLEACREKLELLLSDDDLRKDIGEKGKMFADSVSRGFGGQVSKLKNAFLEQTKKVSVIIPVGYDTARIIPTLKSLVQQTYKNLEVIVVGDGIEIPPLTPPSKGGDTGGVDFKFQVSSFTIPKSGAAVARNMGAKHATGDYLLFVDDDTVLREDCVEKMVRRLETRIMDHGSWIKNNGGDNKDPSSKFSSEGGIPQTISNKNQGAGQVPSFVYSGFRMGWKTFPAVPFDRTTAYQYPYFDVSSMIRRDAFPRFDESLKRLQDWDLFLTILDNGGIGEPICEILYFKKARLFKNLFKQNGISFWFPKFVWKLPIMKDYYHKFTPVKNYQEALITVKKKHLVS